LAVYRFGGLAPNNTFIVLRSSDSAITYQTFGDFNTDYVVPGDYDGDGKYDFAIARAGTFTNTSNMVWWIQQSSTGTVRVQPFGLGSDRPTQGDYDGDARTDISVYRAGATGAASTFWTLRSLDSSVQAVNWGIGGDFATATFDAH
jgi:hypothetical protein